MTDLATLQIRIQSLEAEVAAQRLTDLASGAGSANAATTALMNTMKRFAAPLIIVGAGMAALKKTADITREFDVLNAQLITATGSAENATIAFDAIKNFAQQTPYDLKQATEGFTQLVNLGLTPSERAMTSYGNTASAMGKDLNQMIEAVADAATGEFERLKEFGIKASKEGDRVTFTFRGMATEVGNNAAEIEQYLMDLGEVEFAGAMEERMDSFDGAMSNLGDSWDNLWRTVSQTGAGDLMEDVARTATDAIDLITDGVVYLTDWLESGAIGMALDAIGGLFADWGEFIGGGSGVLGFLSEAFVESFKFWGGLAMDAVSYIIEAFLMLPPNLKAVVERIGVELGALVDYGKAFGQGLVDVLVVKFQELLGKAKVYAKAVAAAFNPFSTFDMTGQLKTLEATTANTYAAVASNIGAVTAARRKAINVINAERVQTIKSFHDQMDAAKAARLEFTKTREAKEALGGDVLGQFKTGAAGGSSGGGSGGGSGGSKKRGKSDAEKAAEKARKDAERAAEKARKDELREAERIAKATAREIERERDNFLRLVDSLRTEEELLTNSYNDRLAMIKDHTEEESEIRTELVRRLDAEYKKDSEAIFEKRNADIAGLVDSLRTEEELLERSYEKRLAIVMANTEEESQLRKDVLDRLNAAYTQESHELALIRSADIDGLTESLKTEEELIADSYERRLAIVLENTENESAQKKELMARLDADFATSVLSGITEEETYADKLNAVEEFYTKRMELILQNTQITEELRTELEIKLGEERAARLAEIEQSRWDSTLADSETGFNGLVSLTKSFAGEQSGLYKVMFATSKAFAIADAVVKIQQGIAAASALPFPANLGAIASTVAATASVLSTISSTKMDLAGAYDKGGMIPAGKNGLVGEYGPEIIKGPAIVTSRKRSAEIMGNEGVQNPVTINIINNMSGADISASESIGAEGRVVDIVVAKAKKEIAKDIREGGGVVSRGLESTYGIKRGAA